MSKRFCLRGHDTEVVGRRSSGRCRECQARYNASPKGKATQACYRASPKGKANQDRRNASPAGRASRARYGASPKGKAAGEAAQARYRASPKGNRYRLLVHNPNRGARHLAMQTEQLSDIFTEVNEVLNR